MWLHTDFNLCIAFSEPNVGNIFWKSKKYLSSIFSSHEHRPETGAADGVKAGEQAAPLRGEQAAGAHTPSPQLILEINAPAVGGGGSQANMMRACSLCLHSALKGTVLRGSEEQNDSFVVSSENICLFLTPFKNNWTEPH